ncbi:MAG TPA: hypothetical protein VMY06_01440 [Sedimentisphaerales bacterium]|nr:hypothetical protein [Sedimentisphaerales bacterium]
MNVKNLVRTLLVVVAVIGVSASYVRADKLQLQKKLSQDVEIRLNNVTIVEALEKIGQQAGVKFALSDEAAWKLPQGEATRLSVALAGPLAESMTEMLNVFFMRHAVGDEEITIHPRPQLEHILGRPTTKQLELLKAIHARPIKTYFLDKIQSTVNEALGQEVLIFPIEVQAQLNNFLRQLVGKDPIYEQVGPRRTPTRSVIKPPQPEPNEPTEYELPTPVTLVQLLSQVKTEGEPRITRWYISGMDFPGQSPEVRVVNSTHFGELRRNQMIDITYRDEQSDKILQSLANRAGMQLYVEPMSHLHEHKLTVKMQNVPIAQAITTIAHMVGASYEFNTSRGFVQIKGPGPKTSPTTPMPAKTTTKTAGEGYVGKISVPMEGGKYYIEFMLRESDLTEELKKLRAEKMEQVLGKSPKAPPVPKPKPEKQ